jgi:tetratricopeptide (TPR) repeat protein
MRNEMSSYFEDPEFKESLAKYEGMVENHTPTYFDADELTDIAEYYTSKGRHKDADKVIDFALQLHPNDTDALIFRARSLALKGKLKEAYMVADLIEDSTDREVKFLKSDLLMEEGRMEEANENFKQLALAEDNDLDTLIDIIIDYIDVNQEKYAEEWLVYLAKYFDMQKLPEKNQRFRDLLCDYYTTFNKPELAIPFLRMTLDKKPYSITHWIELGKCYLQQGNHEEAHEAFDFALAINDKDEDALALKAFTYKQCSNLEDAIHLYKKLVEVSGNQLRPLLTLAKTYFEARDYQSALKHMQELMERKSEFSKYEQAELHVTLALCYAGAGNPTGGYEHIRIAKDLNGTDVENCVHIGQFYLMDEDQEDAAVREFDYALEHVPDDERFDTLIVIASVCFDLRKLELAAKYFEQINSEFPNASKATYFFLVYCYFYLQQIAPCMRYLAKIKTEVPDMYESLGSDDGLITDKRFNELLCELKENISNGQIDLSKYL